MPDDAAVRTYFELSHRDGRYTNGGPCHDLLAERCGAIMGGSAVPVANATLGLIVALRALVADPIRRREVLVPSFTFAATAAAVVWSGLEPVFCDVDDQGWHLDPDALDRALDGRRGSVGAVLACATFGTPAPSEQWTAWREIADSAGVPVVVDSAAGMGTASAEPPADACVFSFHATKPVPAGEGGVVLARDPQIAARIARLTNFGFDDEGVPVSIGLNAKLSEWHAASALASLDRASEILLARRSRAGRICAEMEDSDVGFQLGAEAGAWQFVPALMPSGEARRALDEVARTEQVELRSYFDPALHRTPAFAVCERAEALPNTEAICARIVSLPMANDLTADEIDRIVGCVNHALGSA